jgi:hypothetical protein
MQQLSPNHSSASRQTLQQSSRATEQNVHTARSPVSVQEGHSTLDPLLAFTALEQRQRDGLLHVLPRHAKAHDKVWHAVFWKLHKNGGITGKLWRIIHELYANSASTPIEGQTTELYRIEQGVAQGCHVTYTVQRVH